jgi:ferredoxin/flavodoxin
MMLEGQPPYDSCGWISMVVTLIFFSQTGNTRLVAQTMAGTFEQFGFATRLLPLKQATTKDAANCELLGIGSPCFNSRAPTPILAFLQSVEPAGGQASFVFATCGGAPGRVLEDLAQALTEKKRRVLGGMVVRGEVHHPAPGFIGRFPGRPDAHDLSSVQAFIEAIVASFNAEPSRPELPQVRLREGRGFYAKLARVNSDPVTRRLMPKPRLDHAVCDGCGWCVENCPMENISLSPLARLGSRCIRCYSCLNGCPRSAFRADWHFGSRFVQAFYSPNMIRRFGDLRPGEVLYAAHEIIPGDQIP